MTATTNNAPEFRHPDEMDWEMGRFRNVTKFLFHPTPERPTTPNVGFLRRWFLRTVTQAALVSPLQLGAQNLLAVYRSHYVGGRRTMAARHAKVQGTAGDCDGGKTDAYSNTLCKSQTDRSYGVPQNPGNLG